MANPFRVDVFDCRGAPYEIGLQLANAFLVTARGRAFKRRRERRPFAFSFANARTALETYAPNIWEELHGLADGLSIPLERAVAEFSNGRLRYPKRGCSAVIAGGLYGRNYDFNVRRYDRTLIAVQAKGCHASIGFADRFTGRLDGMNEHGLCIGLHYVNETNWKPGLVCILIVRIVLDRCASTEDAIALLRRLPHGLGFNYSLLDKAGDAAVVEASPASLAVRRHSWLACTNHFQSPALQIHNRRNSGSSRRRLPPLEAWAGEGLAPDALFRALNDSRSLAFHHGYAKGSGTLHTIVAEPSRRLLHVGIGDDAVPTTIDVGAWASGAPLGFAVLAGQLGGQANPFDPSRRVRATADAVNGKSFVNIDLANATFIDLSLAGAMFSNIDLASARFDDVNFANAEITDNCNFKGMRIGGVSVSDLFAAYRRARSGR